MRKILFSLLILNFVLTGCFLKKSPALNDASKKQENKQVEENINKQEENKEEEKIENNQGNKEYLTADWQTYRNEEYGFEFIYPKSLFIYTDITNKKRVYIQSIEGEVTKGEIPDNFKRVWIAYSFDKNKERDESSIIKDYQGVKSSIVVNNGITMRIYKYKDSELNEETMEAYWSKNGNNYMADCASEVGQENSKEEVNILEKIISNFKFINTDETADWQTYRNEEYGFEVKYPSNLILKDGSLWTKENYNYRYITKGKDYIANPEIVFQTFSSKDLDSIISNDLIVDDDYYFKNKDKIKQTENINGNEFKKVENIDSQGCFYYISNNNSIIKFSTIYNCNNDNINIVKEILSTFKFIN